MDLYTLIKNGVYTKMIYKYRDFGENSMKILKNGELYFANPTEFNDPFDCQIPCSLHYEINDLRAYAQKVNNSQLPDIEEEKILKITKDFFSKELAKEVFDIKICCFSKSPKIIPMWSYYGDDHKGFCLGFDPKLDLKTFLPREVDYPKDNEHPEINFIKDKNSIAKLIYTKSNHWRHEEEVRCLSTQEAKVVKFKKEALKEVIFGVNCPENKISMVKKIMNAEYNVTFYKCIKSKNKFELELDVI